jgi:putative FmdB family regulatory protein
MPTYKYRREDGTTFEIRQKITADALEECPETGQPVERVITGGMGFQLKGGGWYEDGYTRPEAKEEAAEGEDSGENANGNAEAAGSADADRSTSDGATPSSEKSDAV